MTVSSQQLKWPIQSPALNPKVLIWDVEQDIHIIDDKSAVTA